MLTEYVCSVECHNRQRFAIKSELILHFWNGKSRSTEQVNVMQPFCTVWAIYLFKTSTENLRSV